MKRAVWYKYKENRKLEFLDILVKTLSAECVHNIAYLSKRPIKQSASLKGHMLLFGLKSLEYQDRILSNADMIIKSVNESLDEIAPIKTVEFFEFKSKKELTSLRIVDKKSWV